jgi:hypothetical protein
VAFSFFIKTRKLINKPYFCGVDKSGDDGNGQISDWHVDGRVWMNDRTVNAQSCQYYEETANYGLQGSKVGIKLKICKCLFETKKSGIKLQIFP